MSGKGEEGHPCVQVGEGELLELGLGVYFVGVGVGEQRTGWEDGRGHKMTW